MGSFKVNSSLYKEGWGIVASPEHKGTAFISDGTNQLSLIRLPNLIQDPQSHPKLIRKISVTNSSKPVYNINELSLKHVGSSKFIWANIYLTTRIVLIDTDTGIVVRTVDLNHLLKHESPKLGYDDCLNGIATTDDGKLVVTGKHWSYIYIIDV